MEQMRKIKHLRVLVFILFQNFEAFLPCWIVTVCNISLRFSQVLNKNVGVLKKVLEHFN